MATTNREIPMLTDTEPETSMELDGSIKIIKYAEQTNHNATKSVFNITLDNYFDDDEEHASIQYKNYEDHLKQEVQKWLILYRNAVATLKKNKEKHPMIDITLLSPQNRAYLERAPNLQNFLRESLEFRSIANTYLENDYAEACDMQTNIMEAANYYLTTVKANKEAELLAKT